MRPTGVVVMVAGARAQQWRLPRPIEEDPLHTVDLPLSLRSVLVRRGQALPAQVEGLLQDQSLPSPNEHFPELQERLFLGNRRPRGGLEMYSSTEVWSRCDTGKISISVVAPSYLPE